MVAGYFAQRAARENQTTVLRVLKEIGVEAVTQNITLDKAVKAKYKLPHKGCGKVSKFLIWAGVPKKVVDAFYSVVERKASSNIQIIHRSLGYDGEIMRKQSDSIHFSTCMSPSGSYHKDNIEEDIKAFNLGLVGLLVLGDINERNKLFCRAKYRFLFNPDTLRREEPYEPQAVAILLDRNYPNYKASGYFVKALNRQYPHLPVLTVKGRLTPDVSNDSRFTPQSLMFEAQDPWEALGDVTNTCLTGFPYSVLGYQDTLDSDDGGISLNRLVKINPADVVNIVSKFQKEAYVRRRSYFARTKPKKGGISYIYDLSPESNKPLEVIEKEGEQPYIHFRGITYYPRNAYRLREHKQSTLYDLVSHTNRLEYYSSFFRYLPTLDGSKRDIQEGSDYLRNDLRRFYLTLLGLLQLIKSDKAANKLFKWVPAYVTHLVNHELSLRPHVKHVFEEISMLPLPTSLRLYLNAFAAKSRQSDDAYDWVSNVIKGIEKENPNYEFDAFLSQDKQSGFLVVYKKGSKDLEDAVLVSSFYQNDKQKTAIKDALGVYYLYSDDFAPLFCEELTDSFAHYFNRRI